MCTQTEIAHTCGCKAKGAFEQCKRLWNLNSPLQCDLAGRKELAVRNYCPEHMPKESKANATSRKRLAE